MAKRIAGTAPATILVLLVVGIAAGAGVVYGGVHFGAIRSSSNAVTTRTVTATGSLTAGISATSDSLTTCQEQLAAADANESATETQVSTLEAQLAANQSEIVNVNTTASNDEQQISSLNAAIANDTSEIAFLVNNATNAAAEISNDASAITSLENTVANDNAEISNLQNTLSSDIASISSLQNMLSSDTSTIASLQGEVTSDQAMITTLQGQLSNDANQIATFGSQITQLEAPSMGGAFSFASNSCGGSTNCVFTTTGDYANFGTDTATSVSATFTFYSGSSALLCSVTVNLGSVAGKSVEVMPQTACAEGSNTAAATSVYSFSIG